MVGLWLVGLWWSALAGVLVWSALAGQGLWWSGLVACAGRAIRSLAALVGLFALSLFGAGQGLWCAALALAALAGAGADLTKTSERERK